MDRSPIALIVNDDGSCRRFLATVVAIAGLDVVIAHDASQAIRLIEAGHPLDVVVSDLQMPASDGLRVLEQAKRRFPGIRTILVTAGGIPPAGTGVADQVIPKQDLLRPLQAALRRFARASGE